MIEFKERNRLEFKYADVFYLKFRKIYLNIFLFFFFVSEVAVGNQLTFLIQVAGFVRFAQESSRAKPFQQNFMITAQGDKWKIVSDCFRFQ